MSKLRLLKINVQPVFVIDDGENLDEHPGQTLLVSPAGWNDFAATFIENIGNVCLEYERQQSADPS